MKKFLSIVLATVILTSLFSFNISAATYVKSAKNEIVISETIEYFEDGSSITTTITQQINNAISPMATKTVSGNKTHTARDADGNVLFKFKISATFSVNVGVSASCTTVSCGSSDCNYGWELDSSTTSKSGNTAKANGVFKKKTLFITTQTREINTALSCDANGVLS